MNQAEHLRAPDETLIDSIAVTASTATSAQALSASLPSGMDSAGYWRIKWMADDAAGVCWVIMGGTDVATPTALNAWPLTHGETLSLMATRDRDSIRVLGGGSDGDLTLLFDG